MPKTSLNQTQLWTDRSGDTHRLDDMSVAYKTNVLQFLERRASHIVGRALADQLIERLSNAPRFTECAGPNGQGCGATHEWAHGAWHGNGPMPGSEADGLDFDLELPALSHDEALAFIRKTPLVRRLTNDIELGLGGEVE